MVIQSLIHGAIMTLNPRCPLVLPTRIVRNFEGSKLIDFRDFYLNEILSKKDALIKLKAYKKDQGYAGPQIPTKPVIAHAMGSRPDYPPLASHIYPGRKKITAQSIKAGGILKIANIPIHTIRTDQSAVSHTVVAKKTTGTWKKHDPRLPVFVKAPSGEHHLIDGNHRVFARANREFTHIRGLVYDASKKKE